MSKWSSHGPDWEAARLETLRRDGYICRLQFGSCSQVATTVDHVVPKAHGGTDHPSNLCAACGPCNRRKSDKVIVRTNYVNSKYLRSA